MSRTDTRTRKPAVDIQRPAPRSLAVTISPYVLLAVLCSLLFLYGLGNAPLIGLDEGLYAECSREMLATGDYLVPRQNGALFCDKPPLAYWLQAASMSVFGVNSFAARLPSALAAGALVALTVLMGTRLFGRRAGLFAGFALATSMLLMGSARLCTLDAVFTLTLTASLSVYVLHTVGGSGRLAYLAFWILAGLSVLAKGPVGAALAFSTVALWAVLRCRYADGRHGNWIAGFLLFAAIAVPWYVAVNHATGGEFLREFIVHQNIQRALGHDFAHNQPFFFYLPVYVLGFLPWSLFVPLALIRHVRLRASSGADRSSLFLAIWIGVVMLAFSLSRSKLPTYILPALPPSALLVGRLWSEMSDRAALRSLSRWAAVAAAVSVLVAALVCIGEWFLPQPIPGLSFALVPMSAFLGLGSVLGWALMMRGRAAAALAAFTLGMSGFLITASVVGLPIAARTLAAPAVKIAREIRAVRSSGETVLAYRLSPPQPAISFYSRMRVRPVRSGAEITAVKGQCLIVVQQDRMGGLPRRCVKCASVGRYSLFRMDR